MKLKFKKLHEDAKIPMYAHKGDSGFDISSLYDYVIKPRNVEIVQTGLSVEMCDGVEMQIRPRSGISCKWPNYIANSPGTIDCSFVGAIAIIVYNTSFNETMYIDKGDRIAQGVICPVIRCDIVEVDDIHDTERGSDGFGSTGV